MSLAVFKLGRKITITGKDDDFSLKVRYKACSENEAQRIYDNSEELEVLMADQRTNFESHFNSDYVSESVYDTKKQITQRLILTTDFDNRKISYIVGLDEESVSTLRTLIPLG